MNVLRAMGIGSLAVALTMGLPALGAEEAKAPVAKETKPEPLEDRVVTTQHSMMVAGKKLDYQATAGHYVLKNEEGSPKATVFFVAYTLPGKSLGERAVTFSFNGGPGSPALWVHLGAFGPKKVAMTDEGWPLPPPGKLTDNEFTQLPDTDLVFIDPVSTGYSRPAPGEKKEQFHGIEEDVESVGEFIRLWVTRNGRWVSPKFIAGESYGTTRAAGLASYLQDRHGMYLNGLVLISSVLNWQNSEFKIGNDIPYFIYLPSYTATAWYHKKLSPELQTDLKKALVESERFARGEYALALLQGTSLPAAERRRIAREVSRLTGVSEEFVERVDLRIELHRFLKELLRDQGKMVGRIDSRFTGFDLDNAGENPEFDPSMTAVSVGYVALHNDYLRRELGYENDLPYATGGRVWPWNFGDELGFPNLAENLRAAMTMNPHLKVLLTSGYYDFATPYYDSFFTVDHLGLPEALRGNVSIELYEAGHMMYIRKADHHKFRDDISRFIREAVK